jgi:prepilin peptidase CpaA
VIAFSDLFLVLFTGLAAGFDLWQRRIPNWLVLLAMAVGFLLNAWQGMPQLWQSVLGFGLGIGIFFIPFALGWMGAGDVKFLGAVGAVLGASWVPRVIFYSAIAGAVLALFSIVLTGMNLQVFKETRRDLALFVMSRGTILPGTVNEKERRGANTIPYGVAIGLGTLLAFYIDPQGQWAGF